MRTISPDNAARLPYVVADKSYYRAYEINALMPRDAKKVVVIVACARLILAIPEEVRLFLFDAHALVEPTR